MARPANGALKKGKKNRKHGRNKKAPAMQSYNAEGRAAKNKARNIRKEAARQGK